MFTFRAAFRITDGRDQHLDALRYRIRHQIFELANLVAAAKAGKVVALDRELDSKLFTEALHGFDGRRKETKEESWNVFSQ